MKTILTALFLSLFLLSCSDSTPPKFKDGDIVCTVLTNDRGQVVEHCCGEYYVRFVEDAEKRQFTKLKFKEFELKECDGR
jgi:hypothetical protein